MARSTWSRPSSARRTRRSSLRARPRGDLGLSDERLNELAELVDTTFGQARRNELATEATRLTWYQRPEIAAEADLANDGAFDLSAQQWEHIGHVAG